MHTFFIVSRRHEDLYIYLTGRFAADPSVTVILDRRVASFPARTSEFAPDPADRRRRPYVDTELRSRSHAILTVAEPGPC